MIDIHMHVIPGVDDGARDMEMAVAMLEMARAQGVRGIIATPHSYAFRQRERVMAQYSALRQRVPGMALALGCEVLFAGDNTEETMGRLRRGELPTLNGTSCVLTEFVPGVGVAYALNVVQRLRAAGYMPVIAHAERCPRVFNSAKRASEIHRTALIQINAYSLAGEQDAGIREIARGLLENQLADFIGSDAHRTTHRPPAAAEGIAYIRAHCQPDYARAVLCENARRWLRFGM